MDHNTKQPIHRISNNIDSIPISVYSDVFTVNGLVYLVFGCDASFQNGQLLVYFFNGTDLNLVQTLSFDFCLEKYEEIEVKSLSQDDIWAHPNFGKNIIYQMGHLNSFNARRIKAINFNF